MESDSSLEQLIQGRLVRSKIKQLSEIDKKKFFVSVENTVMKSKKKKLKGKNKAQTKMSSLDLNIALKIIPEFDGTSSQLHKFIACSNTVNDSLNAADKKLFLDFVVKPKLLGAAYEVVKYKEFHTYESLRDELKLKFSITRSIAHIQSELFNIQQLENEQVRSYAERVQKLLSELNDACIASQGEDAADVIRSINSITAIKSFENGLNSNLKVIIKACRFTDLKEAIEKAMEEELSFPSKNASNVITCSYCKNVGHHISACRKRMYNNNNKPSTSFNPPTYRTYNNNNTKTNSVVKPNSSYNSTFTAIPTEVPENQKMLDGTDTPIRANQLK